MHETFTIYLYFSCVSGHYTFLWDIILPTDNINLVLPSYVRRQGNTQVDTAPRPIHQQTLYMLLCTRTRRGRGRGKRNEKGNPYDEWF